MPGTSWCLYADQDSSRVGKMLGRLLIFAGEHKMNPGGAVSAAHDDDVNRPGAAAQCVFERIAEKWTLLILTRLSMSPMHYLALQRSLGGVSKKVLTQTLRRLERDGLVTRRPEHNHSTVEYSLTGLGQSLCGPLEALRRWSEENALEVEGARQRFDAAFDAILERRRRQDDHSRE